MLTHSSSNILPEIHQFTSPDPMLQIPPSMDEFWKLETIGITPPDKVEDNDGVMRHFNETITKVDGRYQVTWPWRDEEVKLPENFELSLRRLKSLHKRMVDSPELLQRYDSIIKDQLEKGLIERVKEESEQGERRHYIPHHAVFTPEKETTKVRIVYDASAKTKKDNLSLNECLHRGPVILEDLCGLLMRFRTKKIGIIADIEKAFLQVALQPKKRDVTRFLWLKNVNEAPTDDNIAIYRFARVPFGIISNPFLLGAVIKHHLSSKASTTDISKDIYVDNVITGTDSIEEAQKLYHGAKEQFAEMSMNLRDWNTNSKQLNEEFPEQDRMKEVTPKVLGLQWNTIRNELAVSTNKFSKMEQATTKHQVLATIASLFVPLGYLAPATIRLKLFLQNLWSQDKDWDEKLDERDIEEWRKLRAETEDLSLISIPRYTGSKDAQLLCFCDASEKAFATVIYLKTTTDGKSKVNLIFSKVRIAPKKIMSIPRLELLALLIGVRSLTFVSEELSLNDCKKIVWTDSQCVLNWIQSKKPLSVFIQNRLTEITNERNIEFRYINTKFNPADLSSRGISSQDLKESKLWWNGPDWLADKQESWPIWNVLPIDQKIMEDIQSEIKGPKMLYETSGIAQIIPDASKVRETDKESLTSPFGINESNYSSLNKMLRVTAYAIQFIQRLKKLETVKDVPSSLEIEHARITWIKYLQGKHYTEVVNGTMKLRKYMEQNQQNPRVDDDGIVRCYSRFIYADLPQEAKTPILLPRSEKFVQLLIEDYHKRSFHAGVNHILAQIRMKYWIQKGRAVVKKILRQCRTCRKYQGGPFKMPPMSPWPEIKVTRSKPFQSTGLDYFGPLYIQDGSSGAKKKVWVCLFTCIVTRAIHLEMVCDLSAYEFLLALRRFISRRGKPDVVILDIAPQCKLTKSSIDTVWEKATKDPDVQSYVAEQGIKWSFIIELSPWMGGFYERLVGTTKMALQKSIGKNCVTMIQLQTFLAEVEAILNSRPLTYVGEDFDGGTTLTPSHFLSPNTKTDAPVTGNKEEVNDPNYKESKITAKEKVLNIWKRGQNILESFWTMWKNDYLLSLRERQQTKLKSPRVESSEIPKIGDVVQIKENTPRGTWKMGRIVELISSREGNIKAATILLPTRHTINRPLKLLYPLECGNEQIEDLEDINAKGTSDTREKINEAKEEMLRRRSSRQTAQEARDKILGLRLSDEV